MALPPLVSATSSAGTLNDSILIEKVNMGTLTIGKIHVCKGLQIRALQISDFQVTQEEFAAFVESHKELKSLILIKESDHVKALAKCPQLANESTIFVHRETVANFEPFIAFLLQNLQFKNCAFVDTYWMGCTEDERARLKVKYPAVEYLHVHIPS